MEHIEPNVELTQINTTMGDAIELLVRELQYIVDNDIDLARLLVTDFERGQKVYIYLKHFIDNVDNLPDSFSDGLLLIAGPIVEETEKKIKILFKVTSLIVMTCGGDEEEAERDLRRHTGQDVSLKYLKQARGLMDAEIMTPNMN